MAKFAKIIQENNVDFIIKKDFARITLTLKCLNNSKSIFLWAHGKIKSNIIKKYA